MAGIAQRWSARMAGAAAAAALIFGTTTGTASAVTGPTPTPPSIQVDETANYAVVATPHPDTTGCNGYKVTGSGTVTGVPTTNGTWTQDETACTATIPGKWDIKGTATIAEPDGDKLVISYALTAPLTSDTTVYPSGTWTILYGVGTYEETTGGGTMNATVNLLDHDHVTCKLLGSFRYKYQI
ncbi:hypothetical protein [Streptomyces sp. NPDC127114]|uniref:hypothetical protein n=1 Tax=Streptomyces sp. NPDC127114 TaxID=3345366 RepID=UPI00363F70EC